MADSAEMQTLIDDANAIFEAAVRRVQAPELLRDADPREWTDRPLDAYDSIQIAGMGKAAMAMAGTVEQLLEGTVEKGLVVVPERYPESFPGNFPVPSAVEVIEAGHPLPTEGGVRGGRRLLEIADQLDEDDLLLVLVSGGGTALSTVPVNGLDLGDLKTTYQLLLEGGVAIHEANAVRKHLTEVGGGQLAKSAAPAEVSALIISDVVGDDTSVIASGPTTPDPSTYEVAIRALYQNELWSDVPSVVRNHLTEGVQGLHPETPTDTAPCFNRATNLIIAKNETALGAAADAAKVRGYEVRSVVGGLQGEARVVGKKHGEKIVSASADGPSCWIWGGETTVTVTGEGTGGRNQEVALGAGLSLDGEPEHTAFLSAGTDGIDGPTDAAGAWVTMNTVERARAAGCAPESHLADNNTYPLFNTLGQLVQTGPTHTNVMDVQIGLYRPK